MPDALDAAFSKYGQGPLAPGSPELPNAAPTEGELVSGAAPAPDALDSVFSRYGVGPLDPKPVVGPQPIFASGTDAVREGTVLERFLNALGLPNNAIAGATRAAMRGEDPLAGIRYGITNHTTFGTILSEQGMHGPVAGALGLGLDIALDPLTYIGVAELTALGKAAKAVSGGAKVAEMMAASTKGAERVGHLREAIRLGREEVRLGGAFAETAAQRAKLGQQAAFTMFGKPIVPRVMSERVFAMTDAIWKKAGETSVGEALSKSFQSAARRSPEPLRALFHANRAGAAVMTREGIEKLVQPYRDEVTKVSKAAKVDFDVAANIVAEAVQGGHSPAAIRAIIDAGKQRFGVPGLPTDPLVRATNAINAANAMILGAEKRVGIKIHALVGTQNYLKRAITPEAREIMRSVSPEMRGLAPRELTTKFGAQIQRDPQLRDLTISQINELAAQGQLKILGYKPVKEFFFEDPFIATAHRLEEGAHAIADINFLKGASAIYGHAFNPLKGSVPAGWRTLSSGIADDLGIRQTGRGGAIVQDMAFPKEVADLLDNHYEKIISPQYLQGFLKSYDSLAGAWKALTLPIWPSYHARNLLSDTWMITAVPGGMPLHRLPQRVAQATKALLKSPGGKVRLGQQWYTWDGLRQLAESKGVTEIGVGRDLDEIVRHPISGKPKGLDVITKSAPIQKAIAVGNARENLLRTAYFIERLARGEAPEIAALETKKRLFQYSDLSDFEKQVMRRVFPFYSWARNNIPFQIQHLLRRPGYGATLEKVREETGVAFDQSELGQGLDSLPQFLRRGVPLPLGTTPEGNPRFARLQNIIPLGDVANVATPAAIGQFMIDSSSPFPKAIAETSLNVDLFRSDLPAGRLERLAEFPGERESYLGVPVPSRWAPMLDLVRPIAELNRMNPGNVFGGHDVPSALGITRQQGDVSGKERLANYLLARTYAVDAVKEAERQRATARRELARAYYLLKQATARGDSANAEQIRQYIDQLVAGGGQP